jgi:hypothetical protein
MTRKNVVRIGAFLTVIGFATLFGFQANSPANFFIEAIDYRSPTLHTTPEKHDGPQTVQALMNAFDAAYNRRYSKVRVIASHNGGLYSSELVISGEIDAKYPRETWLQLLLDRGITIEDFGDYTSYLSKRHTLVFLEDHPDLRKLQIRDILPANDWEAHKAVYIDKLVAGQKQFKRAKAQIERGNKQVERANKQLNSQQLENARKQLEDARKQLEDARKHIERLRELTE